MNDQFKWYPKSLAATVLLLLLMAVAELPIAYNLHYLLLQKPSLFTLNYIQIIKQMPIQALKLYGLFLLLDVIAIAYFFLKQSWLRASNDLMQITPDIRTPVPSGRGEHGTAKWMSKEKLDKYFDKVILNFQKGELKKLQAQGQDDIIREEFDKIDLDKI